MLRRTLFKGLVAEHLLVPAGDGAEHFGMIHTLMPKVRFSCILVRAERCRLGTPSREFGTFSVSAFPSEYAVFYDMAPGNFHDACTVGHL